MKGCEPIASKKLGRQSLAFDAPPQVLAWGSVVGDKEGKGPLRTTFDHIGQDELFGAQSFEQAETALQKAALGIALGKAQLKATDLDYLCAGDLLNQCIASAFAARDISVPFLGLYGACSTMAEGLIMGSILVDGGFGTRVAALASSHFCSAERQYRTPLEYGGQRTPTAQWTVTGAGCVLLGNAGGAVRVTHATLGIVTDKGICDVSNMGAAMAPAAYETLCAHFADTGRAPNDYDLIVTGDLGTLGSQIVADFFQKDGVTLKNYEDCGALIFDPVRQDVHCGGSGCGCSASVLAGYLLGGLAAGTWHRVLFCGTGALLSPTSALQGESIPGICHAVALES